MSDRCVRLALRVCGRKPRASIQVGHARPLYGSSVCLTVHKRPAYRLTTSREIVIVHNNTAQQQHLDPAHCFCVLIVGSCALCLADLLEYPVCESAGPVLFWGTRALSVAAIATTAAAGGNLSPSLYEHSRGRGSRGHRGGCTSARCRGTGDWAVFPLAGSAQPSRPTGGLAPRENGDARAGPGFFGGGGFEGMLGEEADGI